MGCANSAGREANLDDAAARHREACRIAVDVAAACEAAHGADPNPNSCAGDGSDPPHVHAAVAVLLKRALPTTPCDDASCGSDGGEAPQRPAPKAPPPSPNERPPAGAPTIGAVLCTLVPASSGGPRSVAVLSDETLLHFAVRRQDPALLAAFVALQPTTLAPLSAQGTSPLQLACCFPAAAGVACARVLLGAGADAGVCGADGRSSLHTAARRGNAEAVRLLLAFGALQRPDKDGRLPGDLVKEALEAKARGEPCPNAAGLEEVLGCLAMNDVLSFDADGAA